MPQIQYINPHIQTVLVDIDNPQTRSNISKYNIKRVPCGVLVNHTFNTADFYDGVDFFSLLNRTIEMIQSKQARDLAEQQQQLQQQAQLQLQNQQETSEEPDVVIKPKKGKKKRMPVQVPEEAPEPTFATDMASNMMSRAAPPGIKKGEGHEGMGRSSLSTNKAAAGEQVDHPALEGEFGAVEIDEEDADYDAEIPTGMSMSDIMGSNGGGGADARTMKAKNIRSAAEEMMRARGDVEF